MRIIDAFTHFMPPRFFQKFQEGAHQGMSRRTAQVRHIWDLDTRFRVMDEFGDDYSQVISLGSPPIETFAGPDLAPELARMANDGMAELVAAHPDRFCGIPGGAPLNNPRRGDGGDRASHTRSGASGVQLFSNVAGGPLDAPALHPLFAWLHDADLPIFLHPARSERFSDYRAEDRSKYEIWWTLGWPYETSTAMARLVFSGAFDRWPNLKIVTHHLGGIVPYVAGRVGHGWDQLGKRTSDEDYFALLKSLKHRPVDYFKMFYGDTAEFGSLAATRCGLDFFGADHVLFASDCPYEPEPGIYIRETLQVMRDPRSP